MIGQFTAAGDARQDSRGCASIRAAFEGALLSLAHLGSRNRLHRFGDLLRLLDALYFRFNCFKPCHILFLYDQIRMRLRKLLERFLEVLLSLLGNQF